MSLLVQLLILTLHFCAVHTEVKVVLILTLILDLPYLYSEHVHNFVQNLFVLSFLRATDWLICLFVARGDEHTGYIDNLTQYRLWRSRATNRLFCC